MFVLAGVLVIWGRLALFQPQADGALPVVTSTAGVLWNWTVSCGLLAMLMTVAVAVSFPRWFAPPGHWSRKFSPGGNASVKTDGRTAAATNQAQVPVRKRLRFLKEFAQTETLRDGGECVVPRTVAAGQPKLVRLAGNRTPADSKSAGSAG